MPADAGAQPAECTSEAAAAAKGSSKSSILCCHIAAVKLLSACKLRHSRQPDGGWRPLSSGVAPELATRQICSGAVRQPTCVHSGHATDRRAAFSKLVSHLGRKSVESAARPADTAAVKSSLFSRAQLNAAQHLAFAAASFSHITDSTGGWHSKHQLLRRQRYRSAAVSNLQTLCAAASGTSNHLE